MCSGWDFIFLNFVVFLFVLIIICVGWGLGRVRLLHLTFRFIIVCVSRIPVPLPLFLPLGCRTRWHEIVRWRMLYRHAHFLRFTFLAAVASFEVTRREQTGTEGLKQGSRVITDLLYIACPLFSAWQGGRGCRRGRKGLLKTWGGGEGIGGRGRKKAGWLAGRTVGRQRLSWELWGVA